MAGEYSADDIQVLEGLEPVDRKGRIRERLMTMEESFTALAAAGVSDATIRDVRLRAEMIVSGSFFSPHRWLDPFMPPTIVWNCLGDRHAQAVRELEGSDQPVEPGDAQMICGSHLAAARTSLEVLRMRRASGESGLDELIAKVDADMAALMELSVRLSGE